MVVPRALLVAVTTLWTVSCAAPAFNAQSGPRSEAADPIAATCTAAGTAIADAPSIVMNQMGFLPGMPIRAALRTSAAAPVEWTLTNERGIPLATGMTQVFGPDTASGTSVHRILIDPAPPPARAYVISACKTQSRPFDVTVDAYADLADEALRYFYHNRIGVPIEAEFAGGALWARPAALERLNATCFSGKDAAGNDWPACDHTLDVTGSWFDAGDFGVYPVNLGISVWTLQNAYERLAAYGLIDTAGWADGRMGLPETGNGISELLDESRIGMESLMRLQIPDGATVAAAPGTQAEDRNGRLVISQIDAGGLVHHKLAGRQWPSFPIMPEDADQERLLYPPSTAATLSLAATGAQCARLWTGLDDIFATRCLTAAKAAFRAALRHPDILAYNNFDGSGAYGDSDLRDEFAWAAYELFLTTGETSYLDAFTGVSGRASFSGRPDSFGWTDKGLMPAMSAVLSGDALTAAREQLIAAAESALRIANATGYHIPISPTEYTWGSNGHIANRGIILAVAYDLTGDRRFLLGAIDSADYMLGRNAIDQSYVSGFGARPMAAPHHRIWGRSVDAAFPPPPPGALSGGANAQNMADKVAAKLQGRCAPQACWLDEADAYSLNEVAINWNAPLVWVAIFLDQTARSQTPDE